MLIYTEPQFRYYSLTTKGSYTLNSLEMASNRFASIATRPKYNLAILYVKDLIVKATYMFQVDHPSYGGRQKHIILIVTNNGTLWGNFKKSSEEVVPPTGEKLRDFSLASYPKDLMKITGYVLDTREYGKHFNKTVKSRFLPSFLADIYTGFIIISQFEVHWKDSKILGLPRAKGSDQDDRPFFYLEMGANSSEVFLVHPSVKPDPRAQLLTAVPRSFLFGRHLVLYNSINGCVFSIKNFATFDVAKANKNTNTLKYTFTRENYPFEEYFKCGPKVGHVDRDRCNIIIYTAEFTNEAHAEPFTEHLINAVY